MGVFVTVQVVLIVVTVVTFFAGVLVTVTFTEADEPEVIVGVVFAVRVPVTAFGACATPVVASADTVTLPNPSLVLPVVKRPPFL